MADQPNEAVRRGIEDAGEKIGGARKDWKDRAMAEADLSAMTPAEQAAMVKKDNVWPPPDYAEMVGSGMEPAAAALVKIIRDRLPLKPGITRNGSPEAAVQGYVAMLTLMREMYPACKTCDDVAAVESGLLSAVGWNSATRRDPAVTQRLFSVYKNSRSPYRVDRDDRRKAHTLVAAGFPEAVPAWKRGVEIRERDGQLMLVKGRRILKDGFSDAGAAWAWLKTSAETKKAATAAAADAAPGQDTPERPHLADLLRIGPDYRRGKHVTADDFLAAFGFRGVEFGNWLPDDERQVVLDMGYDALHDLADILGLPPLAVSLNGTLAVAFGARGQGGAAAHYEPGRRVLNLTRLNGAGSLAHEWIHGVDHWLGTTGGLSELERGEPRFASGYHEATAERVSQLPMLPEALGTMVDVLMRTISVSPRSRAGALAAAEERLTDFRGRLERNITMTRDHLANVPAERQDRKWLKEKAKFFDQWTRLVAASEAALEKVKSSPEDADFGGTESSYLANAKLLCGKSGDYWKRPTELMARSVECVIFDALAASGRQSDYLVHGVEDGRFSGPCYKGDPYPAKEERARISDVALELFAGLPALLNRSEDDDLRPAPAYAA